MLKLDIGCSGRGTKWDGFIGVDIHNVPNPINGRPYIKLDFVRDDLPWESGTVDEIVMLHVIEHLTREEGVIAVKRAYDLLKSGGVMNIAVPDLMLLCKSYIEGNELLKLRHGANKDGKEVWPGETYADRLNWAIHQETHKWAYDQSSLVIMCFDAIGEPTKDNWVFGKLDKKYNTRPDHETGIRIVKG